jgi:hypothetical protein
MTAKEDLRLEGLRELAAMIAENYRRQLAGASKTGVNIFNFEAAEESENDVDVTIQMHDPEYEGLYTETVKVENFLRNRKSRAKQLLKRQNVTT